MNKNVNRLLMIFLIVATSALADGIYIRNGHNRMIYGPVISGTKLEVAASRDSFMGDTYECIIPSEDEISFVSNLHAVVIPLIQLTNAPIAEVIAEINKQAQQAGATSFTASVDLEGYHWRKDIPVICSLSEDSRTNVPKVSLNWRYVSLFTIFEEISRMTDLPVNLVNGKIILSQRMKEQLSNMTTEAAR